MRGSRKLIVVLAYLLFSVLFSVYGVSREIDPIGISAICTSWATGVGLFMYGNVNAARVVKGGSKE